MDEDSREGVKRNASGPHREERIAGRLPNVKY
jgi:hypothetical protein